VTTKLAAVNLTRRSPSVLRILQNGAELIAEEARRRAPSGATGNLRTGVYTASAITNHYRQLTRRDGQRVNSPLKNPPRLGQVLLVNSTYYTRWVEKGRKPGKGRHDRTVGRQYTHRKRGKPFFRPAIRAQKPQVQQTILRQLDKLLADKAK
jgi:hypothetical protein